MGATDLAGATGPVDATGPVAATGLAESAEKLRALAAEHAAEADRRRALAPQVVAAVREAGFPRHFAAAARGGAEGTFTELTRAVITVAEGCPATAWYASLSACSTRFAAHLPEEGRRALWESGPDTVVATALAPSGRAVPDATGGWHLTGTWRYVSGVEHADWVLVCAPAGAEGAPPELRFFALPRAACAVRASWDAIGMRATGSHTLVVSGATVPGARSFPRADLLTGHNAGSAVPAHRVPLQAVGALAFVAPVVGAGAGALRACAAGTVGGRRTPAAETALVRASGRLDAARHLVEESAATADGRHFTPEPLARNERNATVAAELVADAVDILVRAAGTGGLSESHPLQRYWRDVTTATSHVALQYDTSARRSWAAVLLGPAA
ncbi:hydrolase [Streptomyces sp. URMC 123]|uniref:hydrolase n=1 Tax=Streptomyces sp. URMC 123 TaxID=3423403 RepID=UPI003F1E2901